MKKIVVLIVAIFAIGIIVGIRAQQSDKPAEQNIDSSNATSSGKSADAKSTPAASTIAPGNAQIVVPDITALATTKELRSAITELEGSLTISTQVRELAAAELEKTEAALIELEEYVEEIEARGDDPADFADEGLEKFQPAFFEYEERLAVLEQAEQMEQAVAEALQEARDKLAGL